jgi:hypothetical protein
MAATVPIKAMGRSTLCVMSLSPEFGSILPPLDGPAYYLEWGMPLTAQRLKKTANTLAALTRNAKRRDSMSYAKAIDDWESDLVLLRDKYYLDLFRFGWPATHVLQ